MTISAFPTPYTPFRGFANDGTPLAGGLLYIYAGGTNSPLPTYQDPGMVSLNTNPIVLNARGEAAVFLPPNTAFKFLLTDPVGNTIPGWPIDNLELSQLITLYGGVDTGTVNAYLLNFTASFSALANGIVIYWIPSNTNTGASTLNVNSLGPASIVNPDGSALASGVLVAGQPTQVMYYNGNWVYLGSGFIVGNMTIGGNLTVDGNATVDGSAEFGNSTTQGISAWGPTAGAQVTMQPDSGSFTATHVGFTTGLTSPATWARMGNLAMVIIEAATGTSNASTYTITGLPTPIQAVGTTKFIPVFVLDSALGLTMGAAEMDTSNPGTITLFVNNGTSLIANGFTASGTKGLKSAIVLAYPLT